MLNRVLAVLAVIAAVSCYEVAELSLGCFWFGEFNIDCVPGVLNATQQTVVGYKGGFGPHPVYTNYTKFNYTETVRVEYDPDVLTYAELLRYFWKFDAATWPENDVAYMSIVWTRSIEQHAIATAELARYKAMQMAASGKIVYTTIRPSAPFKFWEAEPYHQHYWVKNGYNCTSPPPGELRRDPRPE